MTTVAIICLTALVITWIGRGAHEGKLRLEAQRMQLTAGAQDALAKRVTAVEARVTDLDERFERKATADALAKGGRR